MNKRELAIFVNDLEIPGSIHTNFSSPMVNIEIASLKNREISYSAKPASRIFNRLINIAEN